eukprot:3618954-Pyramimonas_sp.AAC.1
MPSIYKPRIPRTPTRGPAPRTPGPDELVATPAEDPTADDEGPRYDAGQSTDPLVTVIVDTDPEEHTTCIISSCDHRVYRWTSEPLVDSPMIK